MRCAQIVGFVVAGLLLAGRSHAYTLLSCQSVDGTYSIRVDVKENPDPFGSFADATVAKQGVVVGHSDHVSRSSGSDTLPTYLYSGHPFFELTVPFPSNEGAGTAWGRFDDGTPFQFDVLCPAQAH
jgi:hypothetical protein